MQKYLNSEAQNTGKISVTDPWLMNKWGEGQQFIPPTFFMGGGINFPILGDFAHHP